MKKLKEWLYFHGYFENKFIRKLLGGEYTQIKYEQVVTHKIKEWVPEGIIGYSKIPCEIVNKEIF